MVFEDTGDTWKFDLDVKIPADKVALLERNTEIDRNIIQKLPLLNNCDHFYSPSEKSIHAKWVMPVGTKTARECFGLQYCPCCLAEDGKMPYFRKHWRLGFFTSCVFHAVQLHDRCPECNKPIGISRVHKRTDKLIYHPEDIAYCQHCGFDLRNTKTNIASRHEQDINRQHYLLFEMGHGEVGNTMFNYSNLYFEGIRRLLSFMVCDSFGEKMFLHLRDQLDIYHPYHRELIPKHSEIEFMGIKARRTGLLMVRHLMADWPNCFIKLAKATDVSAQFFSTPYLYFPYWVADVLKFEIREEITRMCDFERQNAKQYFERKLGRKLKNYEVARFLKKLYVDNASAKLHPTLKSFRNRNRSNAENLYSVSIELRYRLKKVCLRLHRKGLSASSIAQIYGINHKTVLACLNSNNVSHVLMRDSQSSKPHANNT